MVPLPASTQSPSLSQIAAVPRLQRSAGQAGRGFGAALTPGPLVMDACSRASLCQPPALGGAGRHDKGFYRFSCEIPGLALRRERFTRRSGASAEPPRLSLPDAEAQRARREGVPLPPSCFPVRRSPWPSVLCCFLTSKTGFPSSVAGRLRLGVCACFLGGHRTRSGRAVGKSTARTCDRVRVPEWGGSGQSPTP